MDRIDIHVQVPTVDYEQLTDHRMGEPSSKVRERVEATRERQRARFAGMKELRRMLICIRQKYANFVI
jgi:magnesium chelatase family protein